MGANINHRNFRGTTPIFNAVITDRFDMVQLLIDRGAEIDIEDKKGRTLISIARARKMRMYLQTCLDYQNIIKEPEE
jgi:ankyrin repeat protein